MKLIHLVPNIDMKCGRLQVHIRFPITPAFVPHEGYTNGNALYC
jgi:hypothetical protein